MRAALAAFVDGDAARLPAGPRYVYLHHNPWFDPAAAARGETIRGCMEQRRAQYRQQVAAT